MTVSSPPSSSGLAPHLSATLAYLAGFVTGILFLVVEKENKEVRFHAWQSIFLSIAAIVLHIAVSILAVILSGISGFLAGIVGFLGSLISIAILVFWIICMVKAYRLEHYRLPVIGDLAEAQTAK